MKNISTLISRVLIFTFYSHFCNYFVTIQAIMIIVKRKRKKKEMIPMNIETISD